MSTVLVKTMSVPHSEHVARILHERHVNDGILSPSAFSLRDKEPPENYMSVHRTDLTPLTYDMASKVISRKLYGYANMEVSDVHACKTGSAYPFVADCPSNSNAAHAGIHVVIACRIAVGKGEAQSDEFLEIASQLAICAVLVRLERKNAG